MIDMKWIRNDPEKVKENIRKKFQDEKLPLVDEVVELDQKFREAKVQGDELRSQRKSISKKIGALMGQGKKEEAEAVKAEVGAIGTKLEELEKAETELSARIREIMLTIPNIIDPSVPIGKDDSRERRDRAIRRAGCTGFRDPVSHRYYGETSRHRSRRSQQGSRKRLLLSDGRYRKTAFCSDLHMHEIS